MKLYKIHVKHYSQKDSHEALEGFLLAESDEEVFYFIHTDTGLGYSSREEIDEEDSFTEEVSVYDKSYKVIGTETVKQRTIRNKGEMFDGDSEVSDLYYGATQYGWEEVGEVSKAEIAFLRRMNLLLDEKKAAEEATRKAEAAARRAKSDE